MNHITNHVAPVAPVAPANVTEGKEGMNMPAIPAPVAAIIDGKVKAAPARKYAAEYARYTLALAARAACDGKAFDPAPVALAARALAVALSGNKDGEKVEYTPVAAPVLFAACVSFNRQGKYTVKGPGFIRGFAKNSVYAPAENIAAPVLADADYKAAPAARKAAPARTPFEQFAARVYSMEKAVDKAATPVDKMPCFPAFADWLTDDKRAALTVAAAALNIPV